MSNEERLSEERCFVICINLLEYNFLRVFAISQRFPWQRYSAAKRPFETQFFKNNLKTDSVTFLFFSIFENLIKFSSLTRGMRKNFLLLVVLVVLVVLLFRIILVVLEVLVVLVTLVVLNYRNYNNYSVSLLVSVVLVVLVILVVLFIIVLLVFLFWQCY